MIRTLAGLVSGILAAVVCMILIEALGNSLYGVSPDATPSARGPMVALFFPLAGWAVATLIGAWIAIRLSRRAWTAWAVAGCIIVAAALNFMLQRYPAWMMGAGIGIPLLAAWLAQPLAGVRHVLLRRRRPSE